MEIQLLGGASEVGRSAIMLRDKINILLDYGIKIDGNVEYPVMPKSVDVFALSHAHLDHSGSAPALYFAVPPITIGTKPTLELSNLLIKDSMKLANKKHAKPRFFNKQLAVFNKNYKSKEYGIAEEVDGHSITFYDAGHILGSALTLIERYNDGKRILYTGDFKLAEQNLQYGASAIKADILITESTYAASEHPDRKRLINEFATAIKEVLENGGTALLPCFAVGRAQELLAILYNKKLSEYVCIDGMAKDATEITLKYADSLKDAKSLESAARNAIWLGSHNERVRIMKEPHIIITTAGMLNGGPVLDYIKMLNANSKIFLTGYQIEGTNGRRVLENKPIIVDGKKFKVRTPVAFYDFSAHAGKSDLYDFVRQVNPEVVVCVHGEMQSTNDFASALEVEGFEAYAPKINDVIDLAI
ncbi:MAG: MBL fold metallo-hydrolase [Candidatus Micrarchaeaceae archaeon]